MDANGTRFHLFFGHDDWAKCSGVTAKGKVHLLENAWKLAALQHAVGLNWNEERGELTLDPRMFNFAPNGSAPSLENRRGAGRDRFGNWYWIDESSLKIRVLSAGSHTTAEFWRLPEQCGCPEPPAAGTFAPLNEAAPSPPIKLSGLAVTENHYLVVGTIKPAGLLIFDLYTGGEPRQILWPAGIDFTPFDMAARPGGGVWVLDRKHRCYWALDRNFNVIGGDGGSALSPQKRDDFQPIDGSSLRQNPARIFPASFSLLQSPGEPMDPIAIEALPDETVLILDYNLSESFSRLYRYRYAERLPDHISTDAMLELIEDDDQANFKLIGYDIAFVPEHAERERSVRDRLYVVGADGNQTYAFRVCLRGGKIELKPDKEYLPMRLFGGKALVATDAGAYYDFAEDWIPLIQQRRPRYVREATLLTAALDGRDPDCVWHRVMLDACIPPETKVEVWSRAANSERDLALTQWQPEPAPYLRANGSEIPFLRSKRSSNGTKTSSRMIGEGTWELLFQRARGRFLQLKLHIAGDERSTPRLSALRVYYPRFSYLTNYLPSVYREDDQSASFLDRYLSNLEGVHTTLEDRIASAQILFDVRSAPSEVLDWLASWFDVALDPSWDEPKRRMFIAHAMEFFQYRGTIRGLTMALHLALDPCADENIFTAVTCCKRREEIRIIEKYLTRKMPAVTLGDPTEAIGLRTVSVANSWQPSQGRASLNQRYSTFIRPSGDAATIINYPIVGFVPSADAERTLWQVFLTARYAGNITSLNIAHGTNYASFASVSEPTDLPSAVPARDDWVSFVNTQLSSLERQMWTRFLTQRYGVITKLDQAYGTSWPAFAFVSMPDAKTGGRAQVQDWSEFQSAEFERWKQFSQMTLGFVPSIYATEQNAWQTFLRNRYGVIAPLNSAHHTSYHDFIEVALPRDLPQVAAAKKDWIDFVTAPTSLVERHLWQDFLARRYRRIGALNAAYGTGWTGFDVVALPGELPKDGAPLNDWFQFETVVVRMQGAAHRFTVLLPVPASSAFNTEEHQTRLALARRIVDLEKPAHTVFDVRFYWAMFRVGEARLQLDTVIDQGSRAPQLLPNLILGEGFVGESYLATPALEAASDRNVLGREALGSTPN